MPGVPLRALSLGDPTAEGDVSFLFDKQCFLETNLYQRPFSWTRHFSLLVDAAQERLPCVWL